MLEWILHRPGITALIFGVVGLSVFLVGIGRPAHTYYDEGHYVSEAKSFVLQSSAPNSVPHSLARPPLGKLIMAVGIKIAGDNPFGWRVVAALCGALTLVAVYLWAYLLLRDARLAVLAAGLTLFNNFLFVMSRVAMMDVFLAVFMMWGLVSYTAAIALDLTVGRRRLLVICSGVLMGLACACKWNAIDTLAVLGLVSFVLLWVARRPPGNAISSLGRYAHNVRETGVLTLLLGLVIAPVVSYTLAFWPLCVNLHRPFNLHELMIMHRVMWHLSTTWASNPAIATPWYSWPLSITPQRGLAYLLGNPVVAWGGLVALLFCLWRTRKTIALPEGLVLLLFAANFFQWAVTPEKGLLYYYYFPAFLILGVAIAVALSSLPRIVFGVRPSVLVLIAAAVVFLWCYPRMAHLDAPWDCALGCWK